MLTGRLRLPVSPLARQLEMMPLPTNAIPIIDDIIHANSPPNSAHMRLSDLPLFQRVLLSMDGTVTHMLELYLQEAIQVKKLETDLISANKLSLDFETLADETVMARKILLQGQASCNNYLYSESFILVDRLPSEFKRLLLESALPIGKLWNQFRLETFKQIFNTEQIAAGQVGQYFDMPAESPLLSRQYWVFNQGQVLMQITEQFPAHYYVDIP